MIVLDRMGDGKLISLKLKILPNFPLPKGGEPARCKKIMLRNRAGLLEKSYSGTFQRFDYLQFIPIQEFTFSDIVDYPYILKNPCL